MNGIRERRPANRNGLPGDHRREAGVTTSFCEGGNMYIVTIICGVARCCVF